MKKIQLILITLFVIQSSYAQPQRVITTGVPFLLIAADARSAGMADQGVATSPDAYSQQYNPAKYAFSIDKQGFSASYTPYLSDLVNDINLGQVTYYNKINEKSAFAVGLRYFGFGGIETRKTGDVDEVPIIVTPNEFAIDGSYSLKLSERFSTSVAGRFIRSQLKIATEEIDARPATTFAFDVAGYYQSEEIAFNDFNGRWRWGFNFQNLGPKINYEAQTSSELGANFLPSQMRLGTGFDFIFDEYNKVSVNLEVAKLLVPTPQDPVPVDLNADGDTSDAGETDGINEANIAYKKIGWTAGIFQSFNDAPGGFSEELKEFTYSVGSEYLYQDSFAMRLGYFHESPVKVARKFFSLGAGFKYNVVKVDVSYLFSASKVKNPLENTLRFSLTFNFGDKYDEY